MKKIISVVLIVCFLVMGTLVFPKNTEAATTLRFDSIDSLTPEAFDIMSKSALNHLSGIISLHLEFSPKNIGGKWYFTFSSGGETVYVLCSAFRKATKGINKKQLDAANTAIGKAVSIGKNAEKYILCYYSSGSGSTYTWNIVKLRLTGMYDTKGITYKVNKEDEIKCTFVTSWRARGKTIKYAHGALTNNRKTMDITPSFYSKMNKTGTNKNYFSTMYEKGKGTVPKKVNATTLIDIGTTTAKIVADVSKYKLSVTNLYKLGKQVYNLKKGETKEYSSETYPISIGKKIAFQGTFKSPSVLHNKGDYYQVIIGLKSGITKNTSVVFSFKTQTLSVK